MPRLAALRAVLTGAVVSLPAGVVAVSDISRRGVLGGLAAAPIAVPVAAQQMKEMMAHQQAGLMGGPTLSDAKYGLEDRRRIGQGLLHSEDAHKQWHAAIGDLTRYDHVARRAGFAIDPSIACLRSVSPAHKIRMQIKHEAVRDGIIERMRRSIFGDDA